MAGCCGEGAVFARFLSAAGEREFQRGRHLRRPTDHQPPPIIPADADDRAVNFSIVLRRSIVRHRIRHGRIIEDRRPLHPLRYQNPQSPRK